MIIGYARTSTLEQEAGLQAQIRDLEAARVEKIFAEHISSMVVARPQLNAAIDFAREGDVFIVTKPDRLARSIRHLCRIVESLAEKKVTLRILSMGLDTETASGRLMLNVLGSVAQFEREIMLERQREGIAKAQREGKYKGKPAYAVAKTSQILELKALNLKVPQIAQQLGLAESTVFRILATEKAKLTIKQEA
jgi:DNA invertase Pin-like site-specific DNA recombinase